MFSKVKEGDVVVLARAYIGPLNVVAHITRFFQSQVENTGGGAGPDKVRFQQSSSGRARAGSKLESLADTFSPTGRQRD